METNTYEYQEMYNSVSYKTVAWFNHYSDAKAHYDIMCHKAKTSCRLIRVTQSQATLHQTNW